MSEDTLSINLQLSTDLIAETTSTGDIHETLRPAGPRVWSRRLYLGLGPLLALPMIFSTSTLGVPPLLTQESSVILSRQRPNRRRVTLAEARQIALEVLRAAESERARFAQIEGLYFAELYEWPVANDLRVS